MQNHQTLVETRLEQVSTVQESGSNFLAGKGRDSCTSCIIISKMAEAYEQVLRQYIYLTRKSEMEITEQKYRSPLTAPAELAIPLKDKAPRIQPEVPGA